MIGFKFFFKFVDVRIFHLRNAAQMHLGSSPDVSGFVWCNSWASQQLVLLRDGNRCCLAVAEWDASKVYGNIWTFPSFIHLALSSMSCYPPVCGCDTGMVRTFSIHLIFNNWLHIQTHLNPWIHVATSPFLAKHLTCPDVSWLWPHPCNHRLVFLRRLVTKSPDPVEIWECSWAHLTLGGECSDHITGRKLWHIEAWITWILVVSSLLSSPALFLTIASGLGLPSVMRSP